MFLFFNFFRASAPRLRGCISLSAQGERGGTEGGRGQGGELVRADAPMSARTHRRVHADALPVHTDVGARPRGCIFYGRWKR
jgi:hypothetical protein